MKIAVVGAGAIGGYLGARLARSGQQVTFIARNRNLQAINAGGFKLLLEDGREEHTPSGPTLRALQHCADAGEQDVVLLTVKAHQVKDLLPDLRALFGAHTSVVSMTNGVPWWYSVSYTHLWQPARLLCLSTLSRHWPRRQRQSRSRPSAASNPDGYAV